MNSSFRIKKFACWFFFLPLARSRYLYIESNPIKTYVEIWFRWRCFGFSDVESEPNRTLIVTVFVSKCQCVLRFATTDRYDMHLTIEIINWYFFLMIPFYRLKYKTNSLSESVFFSCVIWLYLNDNQLAMIFQPLFSWFQCDIDNIHHSPFTDPIEILRIRHTWAFTKKSNTQQRNARKR